MDYSFFRFLLRASILGSFIFVTVFPVFAQTPDDVYLDEQWYLEQIHAQEAWDVETGDGSVVVAILDTGFDLDHPDLKQNLWINTKEIADDGIDNDHNGYVDDLNGYDFIDEDGSPVPDQDNGFEESAVSHGTVIAGIIGGVGNNGKGIAGINWDVQLMSIRILDSNGIGDSYSVYKGVKYAIKNGADVINLSFTGFDVDDLLSAAIEEAYRAGIVVVAAMGNAEPGINTDDQAIYPSCYGEEDDHDWILGVAATDTHDEKAFFSNYGSLCTDISAPGEDIFSTVYQDDDWQALSQGYYQGGWSGTSMASPMISGAAALLKSAYHSLTPDDIKSILRLSVDPVISTGDAVGKMGAGRLNLSNALAIAPSFADPGDGAMSSSSVPVQASSYRIAVAPEFGSPPIVRILTNDGSKVTASFNAYDSSFSGGVRLAMGDVDGDGEEEIVTVPGPGGGAQVRIFDLNGKLEGQFFAFDESFRSGFFIATGDTDGDGIEEIVVSMDADSTNDSQILIFNSKGTVQNQFFSSFGNDDKKGSIRVALADVDGDQTDEVVVARGNGFQSIIQVYQPDGTMINEFLAYDPSYDKGVFVASGDLDGDGDDEIVTGTDTGGGPQVQIFDGVGKKLGTFFAYDDQFRGGVRLSVGNLSDWPGASIITVAGPGGGPHVRVYNGYAKLIGTFFSDDENNHMGLNSAAWGL
ncbi:S8 family serine peptidase [Candidatus Uhrbacteria bacterium]|nr:S8 family serine peptidase [Candidatus Uhrbacteria bacterium]